MKQGFLMVSKASTLVRFIIAIPLFVKDPRDHPIQILSSPVL